MNTKPAFCPICGKPIEVIRHIEHDIFEIMCENETCKIPCVVFTNDFIKL